MKTAINYNKRKAIYEEHLSEIRGIKFTSREIDVIACIVHNRGEKKIALLLSISPRTVGTHVRNIMLKLGYNSREHIIDFIEKSGKSLFIKQCYLHLLLQLSFRNQLIRIAREINKQKLTLIVSYSDQLSKLGEDILYQLTEHLKLANVTLSNQNNFSEPKNGQEKCIFLLFDKKQNLDNKDNAECLDFTNEDYYFLVFELIAKVTNHNLLQEIIQDFKGECQTIMYSNEQETPDLTIKKLTDTLSFKQKLTSRKFNILLLILALFCASAFVTQRFFTSSKTSVENKQPIIYDLLIPHESVLLKRERLFDKIDEKLTGKKGIEVVVLVGPGGVGKTTIARDYAYRQKGVSLVWEINAETRDTMLFSLEKLAYSACQTEEEKQEVQIIQKMKDIEDRERRIAIFLKNKAKNYPNWLVIYNNAQGFKDILKYLPNNPVTWGNGRVIITTCDSNIAYNSHIPTENVIQIEELNKDEKLQLFSKIINNGQNYSSESEDQRLAAIDFLEKIPPFPLDVSLAAYYIKAENTSYNDYLKHLNELNEGFNLAQEDMLKDIGEYEKTRYDIVTLSLQRIMEIDPDFADLLVLISMIDAGDIPKDLLIKYKGDITVNKFIHELRRFSLIDEKPIATNKIPTFSMHRSTQGVALAYLAKSLKLQQNTTQLQAILNVLENYEIKDFEVIFINHAETFLSHHDLLQKVSTSGLKANLGDNYFYAGNYQKAKELLEQVLISYKNHYGSNHIKTSRVLTRLGSVYRNMGDYKKAKELLEQSFIVHKNHHGDDCIDTALVSTYLGSVYRNVGDYKEAKKYLEYALAIYKRNVNENYKKISWTEAYLGNVYRNIGDYKKARELLEHTFDLHKTRYSSESVHIAWILTCLSSVYKHLGNYNEAKALLEQALSIYRKRHGEDCTETAWVLSHLGAVYMYLGDNLKAKNLIENSLEIYNNHFKDDHIIIAWVYFQLGNTYQALGDYETSRHFLEKTYNTYLSYYGKEHIQTAWVLNSLGKTHLLEGNINTAEQLITQALSIFQQNNYPESFVSLEYLSDLYMKRSAQELEKGNIAEAEIFKKLSADFLNRSLGALQIYFPENSPHILRIQAKIKGL